MAKNDLKTVKIEDLQKNIAKNREELRKARFNVAGAGGIKTNAKALRKEVARMMTEINSRKNK